MTCYLCDRPAQIRAAVSLRAEAAFCAQCVTRWELVGLEERQELHRVAEEQRMARYAAEDEPTTLESWPPIIDRWPIPWPSP